MKKESKVFRVTEDRKTGKDDGRGGGGDATCKWKGLGEGRVGGGR